MDTEEEEGSKLLSNPSFEVEHDDDDSANVTAKTTVVDSGGEFGKDTDTQCEPESAVELNESEPPQQPQPITREGGDSIGDELVESRVDDEDGGAESREDSQPLAAPVVGAEDGGFVAGEGGVEDVMMDGGDSSVPVAVAAGEGNDEEEIGKEENPEVEREVADTVLETEEKDEEADDTGVKADVAEEMEEKADAAEEMEEKADAAEETEGRTAVGEETGEMTEVGEETKEIAEEIKVIDATEVEDTEIAEEVDAADLVKDTAAVADETEFDDVEERMEMQEEETEVAGEAGETDSAEEMEKETEEAEETELREETDVEMETGDMAEETDEAEADETEKADVAEETEEAEADETEKADVEEMEIGEEVEEVSKTAGGKRKRGGKNSKSPGRAPSRKKAEEDVCFICFDGGELVLCDRRGCPKAYHPACVNRDEAFFRAKGRWNCGWHLCSICEKNAFYMCYTCTFSLCKGCIKDAAILCVRGNKGFCEACMKTVMLIEKNEQGNKEMGQVDFDDKGSWEYLFKDYWLDLKGRLSLSIDELAHAKNPWKGSDMHASKQDSPDDDYDANKDGGHDSDSSGHAEATVPKRRKGKRRPKSRAKENDSPRLVAVTGAEGASTDENTEWASPELVELVMHMRNGDNSVLSQFDVQTLLLEYIKKYKLRDPHRRTHVICDARLQNLFGKPRVGHFEMLKLLESHFLAKEESQVDDLQESVVDTEANQLEADGSFDALIKGGKKRRTRKKGDGRGLQSNLDDFAAIDMHNINLIYLRRNLLEELLEDTETFHDKVVGCFARIRISGSVQKQDLYRLVQVVGTSKVAESYKVGKRTTDILLEVLNLNKTEVISIDIISNQEFTEDECKRLRQSIKCGLINRLTVGDIQEKAIALQAVRVNDWMESEILRLSHLRDRASDMGHRKELRECVEKLQLLKMPEERQRRLEEIPDIHSDPNMDPNYESEEDDGEAERQENYMKPRGSAFSRRGREQISPRALNEFSSGTRNYSSGNKELSRNMSNKGMNKGDDFNGSGEIVNENLWNQGRDKEMQQSNSWEKPRSALNLETGARNSHSVVLSESIARAASEISPTSAATGVTQSGAKINESEKIWYYKDPSGKVQGPFSMVQLRKWNNTGYFPANLRIWSSTEMQDDSILLADALAGKFHKDPPLVDASFPKSQTVSYSGKAHGVSLQQGMEGQVGGNSNFDQNRTSLNSHNTQGSLGQPVRESWKFQSESGSMGGAPLSSIEAPKHFRDGWGSETNLPSPTPTQRTVEAKGKTFEKEWSPTPDQPSGTRMIANMFSGDHGGQQSSAVVVPESGQLINSSTPLSSTSKFSGGVDGLNMSHGVSSAMQVNVHQLPATAAAAVASMNPVDLKNIAASLQSLVQHSSTHTPVETRGWGSSVVARPEMISPSPKPGSASQTWGSVPSQRLESNNSVSMPAQSPAFAQAPHVSSFSTGNSSGGFPAPVPSGIPPSDSWRPQVPGHSNVQVPVQSNLPWGTGVTANQNAVPRQGQENQNTGWGQPMPGNPNMGWGGQVPANTNMNWGAPGQVQAPGNANSGWAAQGQGQAPGHANPGWAAPGQGQIPGNAIPGWAPPGQGPAPLNANPGWVAPGQGPPPGNANPGWAAPSGNNPGMWGNEQNNGGDRFSNQRDRGSQGGDSGYGGGRPWNRQSSFGNRGGGGDSSRPPFNKGQRVEVTCKGMFSLKISPNGDDGGVGDLFRPQMTR
ncbi:hypothetical protein Q3G72_027469 [Acer saccharum]|nr:hypothetical protein Q3G72_027469 [Acer saccharum]